MNYEIDFRGRITILGDNDDDTLEAHLTDVMDELAKLEESNPSIQDIDMSASVAGRTVRVTMTILDVEEVEEATGLMATTLRTAIHAAGGFTRGWDQPDKFRVDFEQATQRHLETA